MGRPPERELAQTAALYYPTKHRAVAVLRSLVQFDMGFEILPGTKAEPETPK
jgi:hypothetical protein